MVQYSIRIEGKLAACPGCGRQPRAYHVRGKDLYLLECSPCSLRTNKMASLQEAIEVWERLEHHPVVRP